LSKVSVLRVLSMVIVVSMFAPLLISPQSSAAGASSDGPTIGASVFYLIQGESNLVPGLQSDHDFTALRIISYDLPYNVSRVHTEVPKDARNLTLMSPSGANHGWESSGPMAGSFFVDVPSDYSREGTPYNRTEIAAEFLLNGTLVNTTYTPSSLHLSPNKTEGTAVSAAIAVSNCYNITSANLSAYGSNMTNVSGELSNDGIHWVSVNFNGTSYVQFPKNGTELRVRLTLRGNTTQGGDPKITGFQTRIRYTALTVPFTSHISYVWTPTFTNGKAILNISEPLAYSQDGSLVLMLYLVKGYNVSAQGVDLRLDTSGTMSAYPEKNLYFNMSIIAGGSPTFTVEVIAPPQAQVPWAMYLGSVALVACLFAGFAVARRQRLERRRNVSRSSITDEQTNPAEAGLEEDVSARRNELIKRKKEILSEIETVGEKRSSGAMSKPEADTELVGLKQELKGMRNELTRLSRRSSTARNPSVPNAMSSGEYDSVMASLARIDDDFEHGRLPEKAYKSVREEYLAKATRLMAERKAAEALAISPLEAEKVKLMEAIVALDGAHAKGEIDAKVYGDLSASYKKELAGIMKRIDESGGG
jgi:hypothetical protein